MTGLKILRDLEKKGHNIAKGHFIDSEDLRKEAIKWIKDMLLEYNREDGWGEYFFGEEILSEVPHEASEIGAVISWIKYFFNITDEKISNSLQEKQRNSETVLPRPVDQ